MTDDSLSVQIAALRLQLTTVDGQLAKSGSNAEGLEDLKTAVDNLRTNVWAVLSASRSANYPGFITRFRLRRSIDILKQVSGDLDAAGSQGLHPEHSEMQILMQQLNEKIGRLRSQKG
jgi:ABC-type phosphate transport system auxiliary subunit